VHLSQPARGWRVAEQEIPFHERPPYHAAHDRRMTKKALRKYRSAFLGVGYYGRYGRLGGEFTQFSRCQFGTVGIW
jgi:hypothetical protein